MILMVTVESGDVHWLNTENNQAVFAPASPLTVDAPEIVEYVPASLFVWPGEPMVYNYINDQSHFPIRRETTPVVKVEEV